MYSSVASQKFWRCFRCCSSLAVRVYSSHLHLYQMILLILLLDILDYSDMNTYCIQRIKAVTGWLLYHVSSHQTSLEVSCCSTEASVNIQCCLINIQLIQWFSNCCLWTEGGPQRVWWVCDSVLNIFINLTLHGYRIY